LIKAISLLNGIMTKTADKTNKINKKKTTIVTVPGSFPPVTISEIAVTRTAPKSPKKAIPMMVISNFLILSLFPTNNRITYI